VAFFVLLFWLRSYLWFLRDDWLFLATRSLSPSDLFAPSNGHWTTMPIIVFRIMWRLVGLHSYVPYQALTILLHLTVVVLLRYLMRRAGVRPWIATCCAAVIVFFGPGEEDITWAFQIGLMASVVLGLTQLILADHDGKIDGRDWLGLAAGFIGLMCEATSTTMVIIVGMSVLWRRGWRAAAFHTAPFAVVFLIWVRAEHPVFNPYGRPSIGAVFGWVRRAEQGTFTALGHVGLVGAALVAILAVGWVVVLRRDGLATARHRLAPPAALLVGALVYATVTSLGRWQLGLDAARSSRYLYIYAALTLPALAVAAEAIATRWPKALLPVLAVIVLSIPWNAASFGSVFNDAYFAHERKVMLSAPHVPFATQVPRSTPLLIDEYPTGVTIGFLLDAARDGKLPSTDAPVEPDTVNELRIRLGVVQNKGRVQGTCQTVSDKLDVHPAKGTNIGIRSPVAIATLDGLQRTSIPIKFDPVLGNLLSIQLDGLDLRLTPARGASSFVVCT
jgi:hypothetical protein